MADSELHHKAGGEFWRSTLNHLSVGILHRGPRWPNCESNLTARFFVGN